MAGDDLPTEFLIWKVGKNTTANGYDVLWDETAAKATMAAYEKHGVDLMIDLNHLSLDDKKPNYDPDARGWCQLELRDGELWAVNVRWTPEGAERLRKKKQRYTSPAFVLEADSSRCVEIVNIALVGMPGTDELPALVAASRIWRTLAQGPSLGDLTRALGEALSELFPSDAGSSFCGPWVCEVYQTSLVYEKDGRLYEADYEFDGSTAVIGDGVEVRRVYQPIAAPAAEETAMKIDAKALGSAAARVRKLSKAGLAPKTIIKTLAEGEGSGEIAGVDIAALADFLGIATNPAQDPAGFVKELMAKLEDISSRLRGDAPPKTEADPEQPPAEEMAASRVLMKILGATTADEALIIATDWRKLALEDASEKAKLAKEQQKLDDTKRRQLTARLVVCKSETPATAWEDDAKTIPAAHLRGMSLEALEKRAEHFESLAGVRKPLTADPKGNAAGETKTFQVNGHAVWLDAREFKICEQQKCDPAVFAARKYPNGRKD